MPGVYLNSIIVASAQFGCFAEHEKVTLLHNSFGPNKDSVHSSRSVCPF